MPDYFSPPPSFFFFFFRHYSWLTGNETKRNGFEFIRTSGKASITGRKESIVKQVIASMAFDNATFDKNGGWIAFRALFAYDVHRGARRGCLFIGCKWNSSRVHVMKVS